MFERNVWRNRKRIRRGRNEMFRNLKRKFGVERRMEQTKGCGVAEFADGDVDRWLVSG